jgi:putative heme-binding domain-containing protein
MRSLLVVVTLLAVLLVPAAGQRFAPNIVLDKPLSPDDERKAFKLPEGFEIQLVASEPDIQKPMNLAFDAQGRLWVTGSVEYPFEAKDSDKARDEVRILEDFGPDGKARKITTFAKGLNIPIGLLPVEKEKALVYSIPNIWTVTPTGRKELYTGYGHADTHGMTSAFTVGFDGWVYACHGYANDSTIKGKTDRSIKLNSGNVYRFKADGSDIEQVTWGQVNPFGICFDPMGNLYSADCHSQPIYQLLRGGYYPSFSKKADGLGFAPAMITGFKGSTAIAGICVYSADQFPAEYRGSAFVGDVMTNELLRFKISFDGSTPTATTVPFLTSKDQWFRPVDVKLGPDGALYIADFYNCIIGHYEVDKKHPLRDKKRGRIWRIVHKNKGTPAPRADFTKASEKELVGDLSHPNLTVRMTATNQLCGRGKEGLEAVLAGLAGKPTALAHAHLLWAAYRLGGLTKEDLQTALKSKEEAVRVHACRILGERGEYRGLMQAAFSDESPNVQRAAAEALGRHPAPEAIAGLLKFRHKVPAKDTHLTHVVRMALRNQLVSEAAWREASKLKEDNDIRAVADAAFGQPTKESAAWMVERLDKLNRPILAVHHITRYGSDATRQTVRKACQGRPLVSQPALVLAYFRGSQERGAAPEKEALAWAEGLAGKLLASKTDAERAIGAALCAQARLNSMQPALVKVAGGKAEGPRLAALDALASLGGVAHVKLLGDALTDLRLSMRGREQVAVFLARINQPATRTALLAALATAPARLQTGIAANLATTPVGAEALLTAISTGKASARLLQENSVIVKLQAARVPNLAERLTKLTKGLPKADVKLAALIDARRKAFLKATPDLKRGAAAFEKHCGICHQVAGKGMKVGPQLDGIGLRGLDRLLEDTLDPNRNVDQAFRSTTINTIKGGVVQGLLLREEGAVLVLADEKGKEVRVNKADVEKRSVSNLSPMPANLGDTVPEADFPHLLAWLLTLRPAK